MKKQGVLVGLFGLFGLSVSLAAPSAGMGAGAAPVPVDHHTIAVVNANQSTNWSGYNQGSLALNHKLFNEVSGQWRVPRATAHKANEAEYSSTWIGIGGGCVDSKCQVTDSTLIQAGTEQDVSAAGVASYSAWWELVPATSMTISGFNVLPGDLISVDIKEVAADANVWTITVKDLSRAESFTQMVPYSSSHLTAEWIEETPVVVSGSTVSVGPLPKLSVVNFDKAKANGANAALTSAEELRLVANGQTLLTPSRPDASADGFNDCSYATSCAAPRGS
jgi:hypothetical protein